MGIPENYVKLENEYWEIIDWAVAEEKKRVQELKAKGEFPPGLDGARFLFADIYKERDERIHKLKIKYGLE